MSARKRFGQHFLEPAWVAKVLDAIAPAPDQLFVEIGSGRAALTRPLAARAGGVVACEIDRDLAARLRAEAPPNVRVVEGDFLDLTADRLRSALSAVSAPAPAEGATLIRVAGNLPYNVASPMLIHLADLHAAGLPFADATVMLQREVADRLTAKPGTRDYSPLTILAGRRASAERLLTLPPGAFRPPPNVQSALVRLRFHAPDPPARDEALLAALVRAAFSRRRKTLARALLAFGPSARVPPADALARAGLDGRRRPDTLSTADSIVSAHLLYNNSYGPLHIAPEGELDADAMVQLTTGRPTVVALTRETTSGTKRLRVTPVPDSVYAIVVKYLKSYTALSGGSDTSGLNENQEWLLVQGALLYAQRIPNARQLTGEAEFEALLARAWKDAAPIAPMTAQRRTFHHHPGVTLCLPFPDASCAPLCIR